ncbi:MAG: DUF4236 domain-containing protein [Gordonia polyisoprenivorans]|nr:DUF4236 domain-containing protein [Gordonia polyisoprenivorans]
MAGRYRKTINLGGGFKLNLNAKSASISGGVPEARVTLNTKGQRTTSVGVPGTGLSYRTTTSTRGRTPARAPANIGGGAASVAAAPLPMMDPGAYPTSADEKKFAKVAEKSAKKPDVLLDWLQHPELGQAAHIVLGVRRDIAGNEAMAFNLLSAVVRSAPSPHSEGYFARHPFVLTLDILGVATPMVLCRSTAALFVASAHNRRHEWQPMREALAHAEDSPLKVALEALCLINLDEYEGVVHATRWLGVGSREPLDALGYILRGVAFRELGKYHEAKTAFDSAIPGVVSSRVLMNLRDFEIGRTYATQPQYPSLARNQYKMLHDREPNYPGLEEALAELPPE